MKLAFLLMTASSAFGQVKAQFDVLSQLQRGASIDVRAYGAVGDDWTDNRAAFANAISAACASGGTKSVLVPAASAAYRIGSSYDIPCDNLEIVGAGYPVIRYIGTGSMWTTCKFGTKMRIAGLHIIGTETANTYAFRLLGSQGFGITHLLIENNTFEAFGDVATQSGAAIRIDADSSAIEIRNNILNSNGYGVQLEAPSDTADLHDNYFVSDTGWCVGLHNMGGAGTVKVTHNNMTCRKGGVLADVAGAQVMLDENEYESTGALTGPHSAAFDLANGVYLFRSGSILLHGNAAYGIYLDNTVGSIFSDIIINQATTAAIRPSAGYANRYERLMVSGNPPFSVIPSLAGCGAGASIDASADDSSGTITLGTGSSSCVLTFVSPWLGVPHCTVTAQGGRPAPYTVGFSTLSIAATGLSGKVDYTCRL